MSHKRAKKARHLEHHVQFGAYVPAQLKSQAKLRALALTFKENARARTMADRKCTKRFWISEREGAFL